jgi:hypothetical protein
VDSNPKVIILIRDADSAFRFTGGTIDFGGAPTSTSTAGILEIQGNVVWTGGTYKPSVDLNDQNKASLWQAHGTFTISDTTTKVNRTAVGTGTATTWKILEGLKGIAGDTGANHFSPLGLTDHELLQGQDLPKKWWSLHKM